jgi:hypothetical protein
MLPPEQCREHVVADYRAYLIGSDGYFHSSVRIESGDDETAIKAAEQLVNGHDVELWHGDRKVSIFFQHPKSSPAGSYS